MSNRMEFAGNDYADRHPGYRELFRIPHPEHTINLVAPEIVHAPNSVKWLSDAEVGQHMGADFSEVTIDTETKRLQDMIDSEDEYNWMIELDGVVVGNACINSIAEQSKKHDCRAGSMAILIGDRNAWGKKIARSVNTAVLDWAFNEGGFDRLLARIKKENVGSIKSFEALGFEYTGDEMEEAHGQTLQWRHYEMTKEHWLDEAKKKGIDVSQFGA